MVAPCLLCSLPAAAEDGSVPQEPTVAADSIVFEQFEGNYDEHCCDDADRCGCGLLSRMGSCLKPSDTCFDRFISPTSNLLFFEDPRQLTEARAVFFHHNIPSGTVGGGDIQAVAVQLRARLTDRVSLIATKDGFIFHQPSGPGDDGWADVALGLKMTITENVEQQRLLSGGFTFELPVGSHRALQGSGDGEFHMFLSGGAQLGCRGHWLTGLGLRLPTDHTVRSQMFYWSNHFDYEFIDNLYGFFEVNWFHWLRSGDNAATDGLAGFDAFNLGSTGVAGLDTVSLAVGSTLKVRCDDELSIGYEFAVSDYKDLLDNRLYVTYSLRY